jgi:hypothetical protein
LILLSDPALDCEEILSGIPQIPEFIALVPGRGEIQTKQNGGVSARKRMGDSSKEG